MVRRFANLFRRQQPSHPAEPPDAGAAANPSQMHDAGLPPNAQLEGNIAGRTIQAVAQETTPASVIFTDGAVMKVKTGAPLPADALIGKTVKKVRQGGLHLELQFQDDTRATITLAEEASSVLLRDGKGTFEYAD
jgi:hypothetical protein